MKLDLVILLITFGTIVLAEDSSLLAKYGIDLNKNSDFEKQIVPELLKYIVDKDKTSAPTDSNLANQWKKQFLDMCPNATERYSPYEVQSLRTDKEILERPLGGGCGSAARMFAYLLKELGFDDKNIRLVNTTSVKSYKEICPKGHQSWHSPRSITPSDINQEIQNRYLAPTGHMLVMVKIGRSWKIINTRDRSDDFEIFDFQSPDEIRGQIVKGPKLLDLKITARQGKRFSKGDPFLKDGGLMISNIYKPSEYPLMTYAEGISHAASGSPNNSICRYDPLKIPLPDDHPSRQNAPREKNIENGSTKTI